MTAALHQRVLAYLGEHRVMTLATQGRDGPWAAAVFYASEGFDLYFLSSPSTRHCADLSANPRVAATIQEDYADWSQIRGVQLEGVARPLAGAEATRARELYGAKFPIVGKLAQAPAAIVEAFAKISWYCIVPDRLYFVDNSVRFGHRAQVIPAPPG